MLPEKFKTNAQRIHDAIQNKSLDALEKALSEPQSDVNACHKDRTPLHAAVFYRWVEGIQFLLKRSGIQVNLLDQNLETPLHLAVSKHVASWNRKPLMLLLSFQEVDLDAKNEDGKTAVSIALNSSSGHVSDRIDALKLIFNHPKFVLNPAEIYHALWEEVRASNIEMLNFLFSDPRIHQAFEDFLDKEIKTLWFAALLQKDMSIKLTVIFKILMRSIKKDRRYFTFEHAKELLPGFENLPRAQDVFEHSTRMKATYSESLIFCLGFSCVLENFFSNPLHDFLHRVVRHFYLDGQLSFLELILQNDNLKINKQEEQSQETALHIAVRRGQVSLVELLLKQGKADPVLVNSDGDTPLHIAMKANHDEIVQLLLKHSKVLENINAKNARKNTPLHSGLNSRSISACKVLLENKDVDVGSANDEGQTPLHYIAEDDRNAELLPLFLENSQMTATIFNAKNKDGLTPFFLARGFKSPKIAKILLRHPYMNVMDTDPEGYTLLHFAAETHDLEAVKFLVQKGVNINAKTQKKETPIHIAADRFAEDSSVFFELLNASKIDASIKDNKGNTACHRILEGLLSRPDKIKSVERNIHLVFGSPKVDLTIEQICLLDLARKNDSIVIFKYLLDRLKSTEVLDKEYPDPEVDPVEFASNSFRRNNDSPEIKAYYAALSVLKENLHLTREDVFEKLEEQGFPGYKNWSPKHKKTAFYHAQITLGVSSISSKVFALIVFFSDGLLQLKNMEEYSSHKASNLAKRSSDEILNAEALSSDEELSDAEEVLVEPAQRFFRIMKELPIELQMKMCHLLDGSLEEVILSKDSLPEFTRLAVRYRLKR